MPSRAVSIIKNTHEYFIGMPRGSLFVFFFGCDDVRSLFNFIADDFSSLAALDFVNYLLEAESIVSILLAVRCDDESSFDIKLFSIKSVQKNQMKRNQ